MKLLRATRINFFRWINDPKYPAELLYVLLYVTYVIGGVTNYARVLDIPIHPWLFPFLMRGGGTISPLMLGFVLLIVDAPFRNSQQQFILLRTGKRTWMCGQILYLLLLSIVFTVLLYLLSVICVLSEIKFSTEWGSFLTTIAIDGLPGRYGYISTSYSIMRNASPIEVTLWSATSLTLVCFLLGLIMLLCNLWARKGVGTAICSAIVIMPLLTQAFQNTPYIYRYLTWISPMNWPDRSVMGQTGQNLPSYAYGIYMPLILSLILAFIAIATIHRCNLDTDKE